MVVLAVIGVARHRARPVLIVLALAPWIGIVILAASVSYDPWRGRFVVAVWVMSLAVWGMLEARKAVAASIVAVTTLTFALCLVQYIGKPSGIAELSDSKVASIWTFDRWEAQTLLRSPAYGDGEQYVLRVVEDRVPERSSIAVGVGMDDALFPYFGANLERHVEILRTGQVIPGGVEWVSAAPEITPFGCVEAWRTVAKHPSGWRLYQRIGNVRCHPTPLRPGESTFP